MNGNRDYVVPAIKITPLSKYYKSVVHIGIDEGESKIACFCGQHHKQEGDRWTAPTTEEAPDITCKLCQQTMRALVRTSSTPYKAIMKKLGQKIEGIETHTKCKSTGKANPDYVPSEPEASPRVVGTPFVDSDTAVFLNALSFPRPVADERTQMFIAISLVTDNGTVEERCSRCCFNGPRPCPLTANGHLMCMNANNTRFVEKVCFRP